MAQPNKYQPENQFAHDVRINKPGRSEVSASGLDREFSHIRFSVNGLCEAIAHLMRDDGNLKDRIVDVHTLHRDVLMMLGEYELFGVWVPNRPYLNGYVVELDGRLYVCTESHDAGAAMDLAKFKAFGFANQNAVKKCLPVTWDEVFLPTDMDSLTQYGVYVLSDGYVMVLGEGSHVGQVKITAKGMAVRAYADGAWTAWAELSQSVPQTVTATSTNSNSGDGHSHAVDKASTTQAGITKLNNSITDDTDSEAATPKAVKLAVAHADAADAQIRAYVDERVLQATSGETNYQGVPLVSDAHVGTVAYFDREDAPAGWMVADGSLLKQADYADLFTVLGRRYSKPDDAPDTFRLPDARAEFIRGLDKGRGIDVNRILSTWQQAGAARHYHGVGVAVQGDDLNNVFTGLIPGNWDDGTDPDASAPYPKKQISVYVPPTPSQNGDHGGGFGRNVIRTVDDVRGPVRYTAVTTMAGTYTGRKTGYHGGLRTSLDCTDTAADGGQPRNIALLCCIKVAAPTLIGNAGSATAGLVKLFQDLGGHEEVIDGALSVKAAKVAMDAAVAVHEAAETAHSWSQIGQKPNVFPTDWASIADKPTVFAPAPYATTTAPTIHTQATVTMKTHGGGSVLLGQPAGWLDIDGKKVPYYE